MADVPSGARPATPRVAATPAQIVARCEALRAVVARGLAERRAAEPPDEEPLVVDVDDIEARRVDDPPGAFAEDAARPDEPVQQPEPDAPLAFDLARMIAARPDVAAVLTDREHIVVAADLGRLSEPQVETCVLGMEALGSLCWALDLIEWAPFPQRFRDHVLALHPAFRRGVTCRPGSDLQDAEDGVRLWYRRATGALRPSRPPGGWRELATRLHELGHAGPPVEDDVNVAGATFASLDPGASEALRAAAAARLAALVWLHTGGGALPLHGGDGFDDEAVDPWPLRLER